MGIEDDIREIRHQFNGLWTMTSEILNLLQKEQPKDRQDREKSIKMTLSENCTGQMSCTCGSCMTMDTL